jgi:hypothetical protein
MRCLYLYTLSSASPTAEAAVTERVNCSLREFLEGYQLITDSAYLCTHRSVWDIELRV